MLGRVSVCFFGSVTGLPLVKYASDCSFHAVPRTVIYWRFFAVLTMYVVFYTQSVFGLKNVRHRQYV